MNDQLRLLDPSQTVPTPCPVGHCPAIRYPGQERVLTCSHDKNVATTDAPGRRPRSCLNTIDPSQTEIPY